MKPQSVPYMLYNQCRWIKHLLQPYHLTQAPRPVVNTQGGKQVTTTLLQNRWPTLSTSNDVQHFTQYSVWPLVQSFENSDWQSSGNHVHTLWTSGKTSLFVWTLIAHTRHQRRLTPRQARKQTSSIWFTWLLREGNSVCVIVNLRAPMFGTRSSSNHRCESELFLIEIRDDKQTQCETCFVIGQHCCKQGNRKWMLQTEIPVRPLGPHQSQSARVQTRLDWT